MITKLTTVQEKRIPKFVEKYLAVAQKPTDRKKATKAVQNLYKSAGFEKPIVIFGMSPFSTAIMVSMCRILLKGKLAEEGSQLHSQLGSQLHSQLYSQLDSQLGSQLDSINNDWWIIVWWLVWAAWYMFGKYIGVKFDNQSLKIFIDFVENVSFIIPYKGIAFVSETPKRISWENQLLHNKKEAAVEYADGYSLYCINGVRVTEKIVKTPEKLTKNDWLKESNLEVRRIIQERMPDFAKKIGGKVIDKSRMGELYEIDLQNDPEKIAHYLKLKDSSTERLYWLRVPPAIKKVEGGLKWSFDLTEEYEPVVET